MITIYQVNPHHAGFGMFDCATDGVDYEGLASVEDYVSMVLENTADVELITKDDPDYDQIMDADGRIYNQGNGKLLAWRHGDEAISMELAYVS